MINLEPLTTKEPSRCAANAAANHRFIPRCGQVESICIRCSAYAGGIRLSAVEYLRLRGPARVHVCGPRPAAADHGHGDMHMYAYTAAVTEPCRAAHRPQSPAAPSYQRSPASRAFRAHLVTRSASTRAGLRLVCSPIRTWRPVAPAYNSASYKYQPAITE